MTAEKNSKIVLDNSNRLNMLKEFKNLAGNHGSGKSAEHSPAVYNAVERKTPDPLVSGGKESLAGKLDHNIDIIYNSVISRFMLIKEFHMK
ncbi:MAG: hypothetical protein ABEJ93_04310 [Candidatus Nanohalobium sp.]